MVEVFDTINFIVYLLISVLFILVTFYSRKFLKNLEENEQLAASLIFLNPKIPKCFGILTVMLFIFAIAFLVLPIYEVYFHSSLLITVFSTYLLLFAFIYFFKTLYEITKSEEYGS
ncbi:MAG: hypothetical protein ACP5O8_03000 [Candidatus Aenigmatarchaeota archaeon]